MYLPDIGQSMLIRIAKTLRRLMSDEKGAGIMEYAVLALFLGLLIALSLRYVGVYGIQCNMMLARNGLDHRGIDPRCIPYFQSHGHR